MDLEALIWFQEVEEAKVFSDWESFVLALHVRFGTSVYDDPIEVCESAFSLAHRPKDPGPNDYSLVDWVLIHRS